MQEANRSRYSPPVDTLLTHGEGQPGERWADYRELGIGPEHIPALIRMATDEELSRADTNSLEVWAPMHAWRALGQLRAEAAIEPLLSLFDILDDDEWAMEELPKVFGKIGPTALPALSRYIADISHEEFSRISAIGCVENIGLAWPDARTECIALLMKQLEWFEENEPDVNAFLILALVKLQAREAAPLIERAFAARRVEIMVMGNWDDVQVEMGLKSPEEIAQKQPQQAPAMALSQSRSGSNEMSLTGISSKTHFDKTATKKARNKMAKQSRKKNRKH